MDSVKDILVCIAKLNLAFGKLYSSLDELSEELKDVEFLIDNISYHSSILATFLLFLEEFEEDDGVAIIVQSLIGISNHAQGLSESLMYANSRLSSNVQLDLLSECLTYSNQLIVALIKFLGK